MSVWEALGKAFTVALIVFTLSWLLRQVAIARNWRYTVRVWLGAVCAFLFVFLYLLPIEWR